jgi:hypothetical protein
MTYDFKTQEQADAATERLTEIRAEFQRLLKEFPEGAQSDASSIENFFKHAKKNGNPMFK